MSRDHACVGARSLATRPPQVWRGATPSVAARLPAPEPDAAPPRNRLSLDSARDPDPFDSAQGHPEPVERMSFSNGQAGSYSSHHQSPWLRAPAGGA